MNLEHKSYNIIKIILYRSPKEQTLKQNTKLFSKYNRNHHHKKNNIKLTTKHTHITAQREVFINETIKSKKKRKIAIKRARQTQIFIHVYYYELSPPCKLVWIIIEVGEIPELRGITEKIHDVWIIAFSSVGVKQHRFNALLFLAQEDAAGQCFSNFRPCKGSWLCTFGVC